MRIENEDTYSIEFDWGLGKFPRELNQMQFEQYGRSVGRYDVSVKQVRFFKGQPEMGNPHRYAVNGQALIDGNDVRVTCICTADEYAHFQKDQSGMLFHLMAGETIPEKWRE